MSALPPDPAAAEPPPPELRRPHRWSFSLIWLVPLAAGIAGLVLTVRTYLEAGPTISIEFETAQGLEAGKTEVHYKEVVVGKVTRIRLSPDRSHVAVTVDLDKGAASLAVADSRFWVERPRVGLGGISGIDTLFSGAYIAVDVGTSAESEHHFSGLEKPPPVTHDMKGKRFVLHTRDVGSLAIGSPVYYRRMPVGRVVGSDLTADGRGVTIQVFVDAPYDRFVTANSRFWNASGVRLALNASGFKLDTQSLATVVAGGVAFGPSAQGEPGATARDGAEYELFADEAVAMAPLDGPSQLLRMRFAQSIRGLAPDAPVEFRGLNFGTVKSIALNFDAPRNEFYTEVVAEVFPERLGNALRSLREVEKSQHLSRGQMWGRLVQLGLRAQLRSGNLITGQLYISLDMLAHAESAPFDPKADPLDIPTAPGSIEQLQQQIQDIARKLDEVPFGEIGRNLRDTLHDAGALLRTLDTQLAPAAKAMFQQAEKSLYSLDANLASPDAPVQQDAHRTLEQLNQAAASLRALSDYLEQHPESLLRGKGAATEPAADSGRHTGAPAAGHAAEPPTP
ncbi:MAG: MCE family protein [Nevskia sp.]|nr:MCE family protein [Nevskia sp.]